MLGDVVEFFEIGAIGFVIEELREEFGSGGEEYFKTLETSGITQCSSEERFAHTGWPGDEDMFTPLNEVAGSQLEDIGSVEALSVGSEVDLFEGGILAETGVVKQVLASTVVSFFPFSLYEGGKDFIGACGFQCAACQGGLIGMSHAV